MIVPSANIVQIFSYLLLRDEPPDHGLSINTMLKTSNIRGFPIISNELGAPLVFGVLVPFPPVVPNVGDEPEPDGPVELDEGD